MGGSNLHIPFSCMLLSVSHYFSFERSLSTYSRFPSVSCTHALALLIIRRISHKGHVVGTIRFKSYDLLLIRVLLTYIGIKQYA